MGISEFSLSVAGRLATKLLINIISRLNPSTIFARDRYRNRLMERLSEMPFLYRDMRLSARDDYVETRVLTIVHENSFRPSSPSAINSLSFIERLNQIRRAILFGDGGHGKTTFFRHAVLHFNEKIKWYKKIFDMRPLPVFVALKTVKNSDSNPILFCIQRSDTYFEGNTGLRRLVRLAKKGRLILFLDGYDEMPYSGGFTRIKIEIETLFGRFNKYSQTIFEESRYSDFYISAQSCRIYLSSRREFFTYNPFEVSDNVQKWVVSGLDDQRIELVENIFRNYRASSAASSGVDLNAEIFMQELIRTGDHQLHELSKSPLFLTVMCYVYVTECRSSGVSKVFTQGAFELVNNCIRLLLVEVDQSKSRSFSGQEAKAFMNRRSALTDEKFDYLCYVAMRLYYDSKNVFDEEYLINHAKVFFAESKSIHDDEIRRGLESPDATSNIVIQIILCGLFTLVDQNQKIQQFDFPHRRFRETLAVYYFNSQYRAKQLSEELGNQAFSELIIVFVKQSAHKNCILNRLIDDISTKKLENSGGKLLATCMKEIPYEEASSYFLNLCKGINHDFNYALPRSIICFAPRAEYYVSQVEKNLRDSIKNGSERVFAFWLPIALFVDAPRFENYIFGLINEIKSIEIARIILFSGSLIKSRMMREVVKIYIEKSLTCSALLNAFADIFRALHSGKGEIDKSEFLREIAKNYDDRVKSILGLIDIENNRLNQDLLRYIDDGASPETLKGSWPPLVRKGLPYTPWRD